MSEHLGDDLVVRPDQLLDPLWAAYSAACFWDVGGCSAAADRGDFEAVTRIVNGGLNGLADRQHWLAVVDEVMA